MAGDIGLGRAASEAGPTKGRRYISRVLRFHLLWVVLLLFANWIATIVAPDPNAIYSYYGLLMPVAYLALVIVLAPVSGVTGVTVRWAIQHIRRNPRLIALVGVAVIWAVLIGVLVAMAASPIPEVTIIQVAITLGVSVPVFGLLMPLPGPPETLQGTATNLTS